MSATDIAFGFFTVVLLIPLLVVVARVRVLWRIPETVTSEADLFDLLATAGVPLIEGRGVVDGIPVKAAVIRGRRFLIAGEFQRDWWLVPATPGGATASGAVDADVVCGSVDILRPLSPAGRQLVTLVVGRWGAELADGELRLEIDGGTDRYRLEEQIESVIALVQELRMLLDQFPLSVSTPSSPPRENEPAFAVAGSYADADAQLEAAEKLGSLGEPLLRETVRNRLAPASVRAQAFQRLARVGKLSGEIDVALAPGAPEALSLAALSFLKASPAVPAASDLRRCGERATNRVIEEICDLLARMKSKDAFATLRDWSDPDSARQSIITKALARARNNAESSELRGAVSIEQDAGGQLAITAGKGALSIKPGSNGKE